jgi:hypothetical protein
MEAFVEEKVDTSSSSLLRLAETSSGTILRSKIERVASFEMNSTTETSSELADASTVAPLTVTVSSSRPCR